MGRQSSKAESRRNTRRSGGNVVDIHDVAARAQGPDKISWTARDMVPFAPRNPRQREAIEQYAQGDDLGLFGSAGTGKTHLATYLASSSFVNPDEDIDGIIVVRSAVPGREIGHLKGTEEEKLAWYEAPYEDSFAQVFGAASAYKHLKAKGKVIFTSTSAKRGLNYRNKVIILEEIQNYTFDEIDTMMTRRNENCRIIITGDERQPDLGAREVSGIPTLIRLCPDLLEMSTITFLPDDCQRGPRVKSWLNATAKIDRTRK